VPHVLKEQLGLARLVLTQYCCSIPFYDTQQQQQQQQKQQQQQQQQQQGGDVVVR